MMAWLITGLVMGAVGSLHCVGMCGPLALSLPSVHSSASSRFAGTLLYNLGRVFTYASMGVLLGAIGYSFVMMGFQRWLSIGIGVAMLFFLFLPARYKKFPSNNKLLAPVRKKIGQLYSQPSYNSLFMIGVLNGMLPCALVYAALAVAVAGAEAFSSALFMGAFGAGTIPMMWMVAFFGSSINWRLRVRIRKAYPYLVFVMACFLILRGLGLGIPFISPDLHVADGNEAGISCHD